jgi:hypothetical protein
MRSRTLRPAGFPIYVARVPAAPLMRSLPRDLSVTLTDLTVHLARSHGSVHSVLPSQLYFDHSHCPVLTPATLAALPSTRAIETRSLPTLTHVLPPTSTSRFSPSMSLASPRLHSFAATLAALPSMSLIPQLHSADRDVLMLRLPSSAPRPSAA